MTDTVKVYDISESYRKDARGWFISPLVPEFPRLNGEANFHIVSLLPGVVRGNHKHLTTGEWFVFWGGNTRFVWEQDGKLEEKVVGEKEACLIYVPKDMFHAIKNIGQVESFLFSYYEKKIRDYDKMTVKKVLIE
jgi:dTDP-4-dehydrorhamnose 3,5-epimerase-like enzyme